MKMPIETMNPGRILGVIVGIIILVAVFALPFLNLPSEFGITSPSLYGIASFLLGNLGTTRQADVQRCFR